MTLLPHKQHVIAKEQPIPNSTEDKVQMKTFSGHVPSYSVATLSQLYRIEAPGSQSPGAYVHLTVSSINRQYRTPQIDHNAVTYGETSTNTRRDVSSGDRLPFAAAALSGGAHSTSNSARAHPAPDQR